jgi:hypothetical protein
VAWEEVSRGLAALAGAYLGLASRSDVFEFRENAKGIVLATVRDIRMLTVTNWKKTSPDEKWMVMTCKWTSLAVKTLVRIHVL